MQIFDLFRAAQIIGCNPWELAEQPEFWQDRAFWFVDMQNKIAEGLANVAEHRNGE